jgi:hypothetical protein
VNSVENLCPFALKMFLVIENHFGGAFEGGDLAKVGSGHTRVARLSKPITNAVANEQFYMYRHFY